MILFLVILFFSPITLFSFNSISTLPVTEPIIIQSNFVNYDWDKSIIDLKGHVNIQWKSYSITGKEFYMNKISQTVYAPKVEINNNTVYIAGESFMLNWKTNSIFVKNIILILKKQNILIKGESIKITGNKIEVVDGYFTSCHCKNSLPFWSISANKINLEAGEYAWIYGGFINIKEHNFFWLPLLILPAKYKRESGILFPKIGYSANTGTEIHVPYYLAINPWSESYLQLDYYSKGNSGFSGSYSYMLSKNNYGNINTQILGFNSKPFLKLNGTNHISGDSYRLDISLNYTTDSVIYNILSNTSQDKGREYLTSSIQGKKNFKYMTMYGNIASYESLEDSSVLTIPSIGIYTEPIITKVGTGNIWARWDYPHNNLSVFRSLAGFNWNMSIPLKYATQSISFNSVTGKDSTDFGEVAIIGNIFSLIYKNYSRFQHRIKIDLTGRYNIYYKPIISIDGWEALNDFNGLFFSVTDYLDSKNFSLIWYKNIKFSNKFFAFNNKLTVKRNTDIFSIETTYYNHLLYDTLISFNTQTKSGYFTFGYIFNPMNSKINFDYSLLNNIYSKSNITEDQLYFNYIINPLTNLRLSLTGKWLTTENLWIEQTYNIQYRAGCDCFTINLSYKRWPYKNENSWYLWISLGAIGKINF